ncbi:MAG: SurA N-terminal domain-containing protein [Nitrospiraceae bacterium]
MIKLMREAAHDYPWLLKSIMGALAVAFIITMGWWGFGGQQSNVVASVGDLSISQEEFQRAYRNTHQFYKDKVQGDFKEETLKQFVLEQLIDNRMWLVAASGMGLSVSENDLREDILQRPEFQRNGTFDPDLYRRLLAANHLTPALFESMQSKEMLGNKARMIIRDSVALTPAEISEAQVLVARQPTADASKMGAANERIYQDFLFQKQQRALMAYTEALKTTTPIKIHRELL